MSCAAGLDVRMENALLCMLGFFLLSALIYDHANAQSEPGRRAGAEKADKPRASLSPEKTIIPAGGSVALRCSVSSSAGWKFDWFRQESVSSPAQLIRTNEPDGVLRVSEGGVYSCRGGRGDPAFYTETSTEVTIQETVGMSKPFSFAVPLIIVPIVGIVLIILLLLFCLFRRSKGRHRGAEEGAVYFEVKAGAADFAPMYAEIDPKKEAKKRYKGKLCPAAAEEAVYSEITSVPALGDRAAM
ncbi:uncharacterized protein V3H82_014353 [Fundulus diaphanus]